MIQQKCHKVSLFNLLDEEAEVCLPLEWESMRGEFTLRDLWLRKDIGTISGDLCITIPAHGSALYRLSAK